jgi:hypothetical protein
MSKTSTLFLILLLVVGVPEGVRAQTGQPQTDPDRELDALQPDFTIITLPTTLRLPRFKSAFRITHRFSRPLDAGDASDLAKDLFGLDSPAQIGLEYRFGVIRGTQVGVHRTNNRTIEIFGQTNVIRQGSGRPIGVGVIASVEGTENFTDRYSPSIGVAVSWGIRQFATLYLEPIWVGDTNPLPAPFATEDNTTMVGAAGRVRIRPTVYVLFEYMPRVSGYDPGDDHASVAIEKRVGAHSFQLNFSNGFGTTMGQLARGGIPNNDWFIGFNISRKFF